MSFNFNVGRDKIRRMEVEEIFVSPTLGRLTLGSVVIEITNYLGIEPEHEYRLIIGTDSQSRKVNGHDEVDFVSAIVIHRKGHGGRYFWHKTKQNRAYQLREKIYTETFLSLELAQSLVPTLNSALNGEAGKYSLEIHIDVGNVGPSREMIREVVGMVAGNGFTPKTKPESYGASIVADRHT